MTFAVSSTNLSGAIGGVNQAVKPNLETDNSFDKILDSRVEKMINQNRRNKTQNTNAKPAYYVKSKESSLQKSSNEIVGNDGVAAKDKKQASSSADDRIAKLKKLAKEIKDGDDLDDKEVKELKDELETIIESLLSSETDITDEQLSELSSFLGEIKEVLLTVESKLENFIAELAASGKANQSNIPETTSNEVEKELLQTLENLKTSITKVEEAINQTLNGTENNVPKTEFNELLSEIMNDMEVVSENTQKILENNPEMLKETVKTADSNTEIENSQASDEMKVDTELKATSVVRNDETSSLRKSKEEPSDISSTIVKADETSNKETIKTEEMISDKNVEILKFENTLIRSAKVNNPAKAQNFEKNIMKQVVNHTANNLNVLENGSEMILKLYPKNLGEVAVKLAIDKGVVLAEFNVESQIVKEVLESNLADLRTALSDKGLALEGLDVSVGDNGTNNNSSQGQQGSKSKNKFFDILDVEEEILNSNTSDNSTTIDTLK